MEAYSVEPLLVVRARCSRTHRLAPSNISALTLTDRLLRHLSLIDLVFMSDKTGRSSETEASLAYGRHETRNG